MSIKNGEVGAVVDAKAYEGEKGVGVEEWSQQGINVVVEQKPGYLCHISVTMRLALGPQELYDLLTHPDNYRIFRNQKACTYRRVTSRDSHGKQTVEVEHVATWKVLLLKGEMKTSLVVDEDEVQRTMAFRLQEPGFMKKFEGKWVLQPIAGQNSSCTATLEQDIALSFFIPPPLGGLFKAICVRQIRILVEDIQQEADKIRAGTPTLGPKPSEEPAEPNTQKEEEADTR